MCDITTIGLIFYISAIYGAILFNGAILIYNTYLVFLNRSMSKNSFAIFSGTLSSAIALLYARYLYLI